MSEKYNLIEIIRMAQEYPSNAYHFQSDCGVEHKLWNNELLYWNCADQTWAEKKSWFSLHHKCWLVTSPEPKPEKKKLYAYEHECGFVLYSKNNTDIAHYNGDCWDRAPKWDYYPSAPDEGEN